MEPDKIAESLRSKDTIRESIGLLTADLENCTLLSQTKRIKNNRRLQSACKKAIESIERLLRHLHPLMSDNPSEIDRVEATFAYEGYFYYAKFLATIAEEECSA